MQNKPIQLIVHKRVKPPKYDLIGLVRINAEAETALRDLSVQTGLTLREIASSLIVQAADRVEIVEVNT